MSKIQPPVVLEIDYSSRTFNQIKDSVEPKYSKLIFDYPTVYIVNDENKNKYSVYVGETTDIIRRTNQHLSDDIKKNREDWRQFEQSKTSKMFVIGHNHFNKSLTLDIENRLMLYL